MSLNARRNVARAAGAPASAAKVRRALAQALEGELSSRVLNGLAVAVIDAAAPEGVSAAVERVRAEFLAGESSRLKSQLLNAISDPRWPDAASFAFGRVLVSLARATQGDATPALGALCDAMEARS